MSKKAKTFYNLLPFVTVFVLLIIWEVVAKSINSEYILPDVKETVSSLIEVLKSGKFYISLLNTVLRSLISFISCLITALILSYFSYRFNAVKKIVYPIVQICRALPTIAVVLLLLFWVNSFIAPIIVTFLVVFPTLFTEFYVSFLSVDKTTVEMARTDRANEREVLFYILLPQMLPDILSYFGSGMSLTIKLMVAAEVIAQTSKSIGYMLSFSKAYFEVSTMIALVIITVLISVIIESAFKLLSKKFRL